MITADHLRDLDKQLRANAIASARTMARSFSWLADEMEQSPGSQPSALDLASMVEYRSLVSCCAKRRLLRRLLDESGTP